MYFVYFTVKTKLVIRISLLLNDKTIIEKFLKNIPVPDLVPVFIRITDQDYGSRIYWSGSMVDWTLTEINHVFLFHAKKFDINNSSLWLWFPFICMVCLVSLSWTNRFHPHGKLSKENKMFTRRGILLVANMSRYFTVKFDTFLI